MANGAMEGVPASRAWVSLRWGVLGALLLAAILIPFFLFETSVNSAIERFFQAAHSRWVIAGIASGLLALDIALPIPSSVVNTASGSLLGFWWGTAASWIGLVIGCVAGYLIGWGARESSLTRVVGTSEAERMTRAAERFGVWLIVVFRAVPVLAEGSVVFAGFSRMPFGRFLVLSALSNFGLAATYSAVGAYSVNAGSFLLAFAGAIGVPAIGMTLTRRGRG